MWLNIKAPSFIFLSFHCSCSLFYVGVEVWRLWELQEARCVCVCARARVAGVVRWRWQRNYSLNLPGRSQCPRGLTRGSAAVRLLELRVRIPPGAWMSVCCDCCISSGRGLCSGPIPRPEEFYRVSYVWVWPCATATLYASKGVGIRGQTKSGKNLRGSPFPHIRLWLTVEDC